MRRELTFDATQFYSQSLRKQSRPVTAISSVLPTIQLAEDRCGSVPTSIFILSTFFQRLGIWVSGFPFPLVLFLSPFMLAYGFWQGRVKLSHARLLLFVFFAGSVVISSVWGIHTKPTASLLFLVVYSVWLFYMPATHKDYTDYIHKIAFLVSVLCIIGMLQFLIQFAVKSDYLFSWKGVIPSQLLIEHNTLRESSYNFRNIQRQRLLPFGGLDSLSPRCPHAIVGRPDLEGCPVHIAARSRFGVRDVGDGTNLCRPIYSASTRRPRAKK